MTSGPRSVTEVISEIKSSLERSFTSLNVKGEVTNLSRSGSGHIYFSLVDGESLLNCCLFRMDAMRNPYSKKIRNGDLVECRGGVSVYGKRGSFQLIVRHVRALGKGDLKEQFEKLKKELASQGLFDLEHKQTIPKFPKRLFVVTAKEGAAFQDFLNEFARDGWIITTVHWSETSRVPESIIVEKHKR